MTAVRGTRAAFRRKAAGLFEQQCWCWGRDVARPAGNVLLGLGMCRYRAPDPKAGSSLYTGLAPAGGTVWLWGFGTAFTDPDLGTVFVPRYEFAPKLTRRTDLVGVHDPKAVGGLVTPTTDRDRQTARKLLAALAGWVAGYEHWVVETLGADYRAGCLAARGKPAAVPAGEMAAAWERLAKQFRRPDAIGSAAPGAWALLIDRLRPAPRPAPTTPHPARPAGRPRRK